MLGSLKTGLNCLASASCSAVSLVGGGVKTGVLKTAHGVLTVTSECADLSAKSLLLVGLGIGSFMAYDGSKFLQGNAIWQSSDKPITFICTLVDGYAVRNPSKDIPVCFKMKDNELIQFANLQVIAGAAIALVASPILMMTLNKISRLADHLNHSF